MFCPLDKMLFLFVVGDIPTTNKNNCDTNLEKELLYVKPISINYHKTMQWYETR